MYTIVLLLHLLGAAVWTGGHVVLAVSVLPRALRAGDPGPVLQFERWFEPVGLPALVVQVSSGLWLAARLMPEPSAWFTPASLPSRLVFAKLILLAMTVVLAAHARLRLIPGLDAGRLRPLAWHIIAVTVIAVLFVAAGVGFRMTGSP